MDTNITEIEKYSRWRAVQIRITFFSDKIEESAVSKWWEAVIGEPSEQKSILPKQNLYQEQGNYCKGRLVLSVHLNKVDWLYIPIEGEFYIDSFLDSQEVFSELMPKLYKTFPPINRFAVGYILQVPVNSRKEGYEFLAELLPSVKIDVDKSSDFIYQINRPRNTTTGIANLSINRLMKWSVGVVKQFALSSGVFEFSNPENSFSRLELDLNTSAEYAGALPQDKISSIYFECVGLAKEIMINGDIA